MAKGLLDLIFDNIFDDKWKGEFGEKLTEHKLNIVQLFGRKGKVLRNVYLPKDNGETSELDVIFITHKGIFIFESKNYSGWIFGDEKSKNWTAMLPNREKNQFYNPILQNRSHLKWMKAYVGDEVPLFSIIVFSERCELKKITLYSEDIKVIKRDKTYAAVRDIWDKKPDVISDENVEELNNRLKELTNVNAEIKGKHIESIESKYKNNTVNTVSNAPVDNKRELTQEKICPKCGSKLVIRTAKSGVNAGKQFYGCSAFPGCRYTQNI